MNRYKKSGWFNESNRHSLARKGIKTGRKINFAIHNKSLSSTLEKMPTLCKGQADDLKIDIGTKRVWVSRVDGSVSVEELKDGKWVLSDDDCDDIDYSKPTLPQHISQAPLPDQDKDGVPDKEDWDIDNDGIPNWKDSEGMFDVDRFGGKGVFNPFYNDRKDSDLDGVPDTKDLHPLNPFKSSDWAKPEVKGQQLRIRVMSPKRCSGKYGTQDVGKKGKLQRVSCKTDSGWKTQSLRLNLSDYKNRNEALKDLNSIKNLSTKKRIQAVKEINKYFWG